jgi:hypothetical protein
VFGDVVEVGVYIPTSYEEFTAIGSVNYPGTEAVNRIFVACVRDRDDALRALILLRLTRLFRKKSLEKIFEEEKIPTYVFSPSVCVASSHFQTHFQGTCNPNPTMATTNDNTGDFKDKQFEKTEVADKVVEQYDEERARIFYKHVMVSVPRFPVKTRSNDCWLLAIGTLSALHSHPNFFVLYCRAEVALTFTMDAS